MKRKPYLRSKKRTAKPAYRKQQILRKEAQKRAKYPMRETYIRSAPLRYRKRSA